MADETRPAVAIFAGHRAIVSMLEAFHTGIGHARIWIEVVGPSPRSLGGEQAFATS